MPNSSGSAPSVRSLRRILLDIIEFKALRALTFGDIASLRRRVLVAGTWTLGAHGADTAIRFVTNLVMTRLLFPEAFGLMALVAAIHVGLTLLSDVGIGLMIIRDERGEDTTFLRSTWTVQLVRGFLLWFLFIVIALLILVAGRQGLLPLRTAVADPILPFVLPFVGMSAALLGCTSVNLHLNMRRLNFKPLVLLDISCQLVSIPIMVAWASLDRSVWALVAGQLASGICRMIGSHLFVPGPSMALIWDQNHIKKLLHSGKWIAVSSTATFFSGQGDRLIFGMLLSSSVLGLYSIALALKEVFESVLGRIHGAITLSVLTETFRERPDTFRERYYRFRTPIEAVAFFVAGVLIVSGDKIVELLYDPRYHSAGWMLQILALSLLTYPFQMISMGLLAAGEFRKNALISMINGLSLVVLLCGGYWLAGVPAAVIGVALFRLPATVVLIILVYKRGWISPYAELRCTPLVIVGMIAGVVGNWIMRGIGLIS